MDIQKILSLLFPTKNSSDSEPASNPMGRFGIWGGVFTPCVLTILGVIMFMRTGFVVGYSGLWMGLAILGLSKMITTLTTLSLSAISTNTEVRGGGVYFMISRVLGPDFGGAIGITLFIAQAVGVSFYVIGFTEALMGVLEPLFSWMGGDEVSGLQFASSLFIPQIVSTITIGGLFYLTFKGADVAIKVQYIVLAILLVSIASFLIGGLMDFDPKIFADNKASAFTSEISFWAAFAIFFPAATGITAGANMSGDLKNPEKSIPWGTLLAILFTTTIYLLQIFLVSGSTSRTDLIAEPFEAIKKMSLFSPFIILGVFAATLSSALGSFLGAPRILQAMGKDRLMGALIYFGKGEGPSEEPQRATILTFVIAVLVIWAGDLNAVAEVISMFFLIAYGMINLSAFVESKSGNPSFRPTFKLFHWSTALIGAIGCVIAMMKINDSYALLALAISGLIYFYLKKRNIQTDYGDAKRGYIFKSIRESLYLLEGSKVHSKNWRPQLVAITEDIQQDLPTIRAGSWLEARRGLYSVVNIHERIESDYVTRHSLFNDRVKELKQVLNSENIIAFPESIVAKDFHEGLFTFLQSASIGVLKPNSILVSLPKEDSAASDMKFLKTMDIVATFHLNLVIMSPKDLALNKKGRLIDLWWREETNGSLMALFAYLMTLDSSWSQSKIRIMKIVSSERDRSAAEKRLNSLKLQIRLDAEIKIIESSEDANEVIARTSGTTADLVFLGVGATSGEEAKDSIRHAKPLLKKLPTTFLVWSNGEADIFV
ncbi:MAG: amino acid permease [Bdellovibrionales bacterium]|nr:amino acid permease [Bdellovibrionales bacterium]